MANKPKLGIVSTYDEMCGIAAYTYFLKNQLDDEFDIEILKLDEYFLRSKHPRVRKQGDELIKDLCKRMKGLDFVNIQLEHGTLGDRPKDIIKRLKWLIDAAPGVSITFHTILPIKPYPVTDIIGNLSRFNLRGAWRAHIAYINQGTLARRTIQTMLRAQRSKPVSVIVHTKREKRTFLHEYGFKHVYDHPLAFLPEHVATRIRGNANRDMFPQLKNIPKDAKLLGVFGFLSKYKNVTNVIQALQNLPKDYHLLVFGAINPKEIKKFEPINPYLKEIYATAHFGDTQLDSFMRKLNPPIDPLDESTSASRVENSNFNVTLETTSAMEKDTRDLMGRIHFMGALDDPEFFNGMCICDAVVFPYLEIGQTSSGPITQAVELGCRVIAARNKAFLQFAKYHPDKIEFFDIGNHVELAETVQAPTASNLTIGSGNYSPATNRAVYVAANQKPPAPYPLNFARENSEGFNTMESFLKEAKEGSAAKTVKAAAE